ncbi:hypothetical protein C7S18_20535 [Ahniella affigens]|uniref:Uncharacterized protein n=1 Tax=Ahniella affigens TaxID=2021234 RepID=A0A2P1PX31_9GAMM|nr:hypothetical protein [Ahniella affigens]AVP99411.1 hypothetical protein C7S18_20535 [Ahniella affigens]
MVSREPKLSVGGLLGLWMADQVRILSFHLPSRGMADHANRYLLCGLFVTWLAGLGRYWDHPSAQWWQYAGLGSVAYVFVLSALLWLVVVPLRPERWTYRSVLVFVTMTSLPALLYAIPVERSVDAAEASALNATFLKIVALWRLALLIWFLRHFAKLEWPQAVVTALLPMALIVITLGMLNLEQAVFQIMAGIRDREPTPYDDAYAVVVTLNFLSIVLSPALIGFYLGAIIQASNRRRDERIAAARRAALIGDRPAPMEDDSTT